MTTKRELERLTALENALCDIGFTSHEADKLRRISLTLRRWHELECGIDGGCIERDEKTNKPFWVSEFGARTRRPIADRETGALKRLGHIVGMRNTRVWATSGAPAVRDVAVHSYVQTDPRGAALYILRPGDVPERSRADSCYSNGVCVY
jgi:hypothetical protein